ncbi:cation transporter, partial [Vibrio parahaemolyticus]
MAIAQHTHDFVSHNHKGEKRTFYVLILTLVTMVVEIAAGTLFGSMA